jgi:CMP-N-acetylneuraminic acid synthetase
MASTYQTLGVILARAGSQGLGSKHLRLIHGREVVRYTLSHAIGSQSLSRIVVSTDCPGVRQIAREAGVPTINRPADLATSDASVQDALLHALAEVERHGTFQADAIACLYGNVPVRPPSVTDDAIAQLQATGGDSVRSFQPVGKWHPQWMNRLASDGTVEPYIAGSIHRRQDLEPLFLHDGGALVMTRGSLQRGIDHRDDPHAMFGTDRRGIEVEPGSVVEVDTQRDLDLAISLLRPEPAVRLAA